MKQIYSFQSLGQGILGEQGIKCDIKYSLLQFCSTEEINGEHFIYNKLTGKIFILTAEEFALLQKLPAELSTNEGFFKQLAAEWCIVPENNDDIRLADQLIAVNELFAKKGGSRVTSFTILPTTDCNARCFYCYEHGMARTNMTDKLAKDTADYIIKKSKGDDVSLKWFGGEPLFNSGAIDIICKSLAENGIKYRSSMISNAYLFDEETALKAKELWKLEKVQITLDGTQDNYNRIKAYYKINDKNPFQTVTDNIERLLKHEIKVSVRLNLSENNFEDLKTLVSWLKARYTNKSHLSVYPAILFEYYDSSDSVLREMIKKNNELNRIITEAELSYTQLSPKMLARGCMAQNDRTVVITPTGKLSKCEHYTDDERIIGNIYDGILNEQIVADWKHQIMLEECKSCSDYIICGRYDRCPNFRTRCNLFKEKRKFDTRNKILTAYNIWKKENSAD